MPAINPASGPVAVTGASGYIGSHAVNAVTWICIPREPRFHGVAGGFHVRQIVDSGASIPWRTVTRLLGAAIVTSRRQEFPSDACPDTEAGRPSCDPAAP